MRVFKKEDGTYNVLKTTLFSFIIACILLGLICLPMLLQDKAQVNKSSNNTTTTTQGASLLPCKECDIEFYNKELTLEFGESVKIKDILDIKDVAINNIKFTFDSEYLEKKQSEGEYYITTSKSVGETTLKADYDKYSTTLNIKITAKKLNDVKFSKKVYYVKTSENVELEVETTPKNGNLDLIEFSSLDESIVKFGSNNTIIGITAGKATVKLVSDDIEDEATVYVMNTPFTIKLKDDGVYKEMDEYQYKSNNKTQNLYIAIKLENSNYTQNDITVKDTSSGSISTTTTYDSIHVDNLSLIYKVVVDFDPAKTTSDNSSIITFTLPDGSEKFIKIFK